MHGQWSSAALRSTALQAFALPQVSCSSGTNRTKDSNGPRVNDEVGPISQPSRAELYTVQTRQCLLVTLWTKVRISG
jgi:hypothetical protein